MWLRTQKLKLVEICGVRKLWGDQTLTTITTTYLAHCHVMITMTTRGHLTTKSMGCNKLLTHMTCSHYNTEQWKTISDIYWRDHALPSDICSTPYLLILVCWTHHTSVRKGKPFYAQWLMLFWDVTAQPPPFSCAGLMRLSALTRITEQRSGSLFLCSVDKQHQSATEQTQQNTKQIDLGKERLHTWYCFPFRKFQCKNELIVDTYSLSKNLKFHIRELPSSPAWHTLLYLFPTGQKSCLVESFSRSVRLHAAVFNGSIPISASQTSVNLIMCSYTLCYMIRGDGIDLKLVTPELPDFLWRSPMRRKKRVVRM